jgi:hypothetical protein
VGKAPARSKSAAEITFTVTAAEIDGIIAALPPDSEPKKLKLFRFILEEWFLVDLPEHYRMARSGVDAVSSRQLKAIAKQAGILERLLGDPEAAEARQLVIVNLVRRRGLLYRKEVRAQLEKELDALTEVRSAATEALPRRGQPRNKFSYRVLLDIAAMYEWLTGDKPSRITDIVTERGGGPFYELCQALWPLAHQNNKGGLPSTIKNWAKTQTQCEDGSALISNIFLRYRQ